MGNYLSNADAQEELGRIIKVYHDDTGSVDTDELDLEIEMVENECNSSFSVNYDIPLTTTMGIRFARGLVIYILRAAAYSRMAQVETPEVVLYNARHARSLLKDIREGKQEIPGEEVTEEGVVNSMGHVGPSKIFNQSNLEDW